MRGQPVNARELYIGLLTISTDYYWLLHTSAASPAACLFPTVNPRPDHSPTEAVSDETVLLTKI